MSVLKKHASLSIVERDGVTTTKQPQITKMGYLYKKGADRRNWKKRWFELRGPVLAYYASRSGGKLKGEIPLASCIAEEYHHESRDFVLTLKGCNRTYYLGATSEQEMRSWLKAIAACVVEGFPTPQKAAILSGHTFDNGSACQSKAAGLHKNALIGRSAPDKMENTSVVVVSEPNNRKTYSVDSSEETLTTSKENVEYILPEFFRTMTQPELVDLVISLAETINSERKNIDQLRSQLNEVKQENHILSQDVSARDARIKHLEKFNASDKHARKRSETLKQILSGSPAASPQPSRLHSPEVETSPSGSTSPLSNSDFSSATIV